MQYCTLPPRMIIISIYHRSQLYLLYHLRICCTNLDIIYLELLIEIFNISPYCVSVCVCLYVQKHINFIQTHQYNAHERFYIKNYYYHYCVYRIYSSQCQQRQNKNEYIYFDVLFIVFSQTCPLIQP